MTDEVPNPDASDEALLAQVAAGGREAFALFFRRWRNEVFRFALHVLGSRPAADDVTQDAFLVVMREAGRFEPGRGAPASWLWGIARNCARQRLDRERPFVPLPREGTRDEGRTAVEPDPVADLARRQAVERVRVAVLTLPLHYREVVVLCDLQEVSYRDAAAAIGCSLGTVRSRLHRGRALLAEKLAVRCREPGPAARGTSHELRSVS